MYITQDATSALEAILILMADPKAAKKQLEDLKAESKAIEDKRMSLHKYEKEVTDLSKAIEVSKKEVDTQLQEYFKKWESELKAQEKHLDTNIDKASKLKTEYEDKLANLKKLMNGG